MSEQLPMPDEKEPTGAKGLAIPANTIGIRLVGRAALFGACLMAFISLNKGQSPFFYLVMAGLGAAISVFALLVVGPSGGQIRRAVIGATFWTAIPLSLFVVLHDMSLNGGELLQDLQKFKDNMSAGSVLLLALTGAAIGALPVKNDEKMSTFYRIAIAACFIAILLLQLTRFF
jgi:hypothetical protein